MARLDLFRRDEHSAAAESTDQEVSDERRTGERRQAETPPPEERRRGRRRKADGDRLTPMSTSLTPADHAAVCSAARAHGMKPSELARAVISKMIKSGTLATLLR